MTNWLFFIVALALSALLGGAQTTSQTLVVPFRRSFELASGSSPLLLALPRSNNVYHISIAICSAGLPLPRFFITNNADVALPGPNDVRVDELSTYEGVVVRDMLSPNGGRLAIWPSIGTNGVWTLDIGLSDTVLVHDLLFGEPLLGDTSSTRTILFSPSFLPPRFTESKYPNYTFQPAIPNIPPPPSIPPAPNMTLLMIPTSEAGGAAGISRSACGIVSRLGRGLIPNATRMVLRDNAGWRTQWFVDGLSPSTNYTAYVIQDGARVSNPIHLLTKSSDFPCPLVHSLPYCPAVSYSAPLPPPPNGATSYTDDNIPRAIRDVAIASLTNFTSSLRTFPCGRDWYSPLQTCTGCQEAYRNWMCSVVFPRCGEAIPEQALQPSPAQLAYNELNQLPNDPLPQAALKSRPPNAPPRSPFLPTLDTAYNELLPCIETCNTVDRTCPPLIKWKCPAAAVNANEGYGLGFIDSQDGTIEKGGQPGQAQDKYGRIWCNA